MGKWLCLVLVLLTAGCGGAASGSPVLNPTATEGITDTEPATAEPTAAATGTAEAALIPTITAAPAGGTAAALHPATAVFTPGALATPTGVVTAGPATPTGTSGWKTYSNANWHVAVDYPPDWSVQQTANAASFLFQGRAIVQLAAVPYNPGLDDNIDVPNTLCHQQTNPHGVTLRVCLDTISFSTTAQFTVKAANGAGQALVLSTSRRSGQTAVFDAMLNSVRPWP